MSQAGLDLVKHLYEALLGRDPDAADQANFAAYLDAGGNGAALIAGSAEAAAQVGAVYQQVLGRAASGAELAASQGYLAGGGTLAGLRGMAASSDEARANITAIYQDTLGRVALPDDMKASVQSFATTGTLATLRATAAGSPESGSVVTQLYESVFGRAPDPAGLANAQAVLASGGTLGQVFGGMTHSTELAANVAALYQVASGQAPSVAEVGAMEQQVAANVGSAVLDPLLHNSEDLNASLLDPGAICSCTQLQNNVSTPIYDPRATITGVSPNPLGVGLGAASSGLLVSQTATSGTFTVYGHATPGSTVAISMDLLGLVLPGSPFLPVTADSSGNWSVTDGRALLPGAYTLIPTETTPSSSFTGSAFALTVNYDRASAASAASLVPTGAATPSAVSLMHAS